MLHDPSLDRAQHDYDNRDESYYEDRALEIQDAEDAKADRAHEESE